MAGVDVVIFHQEPREDDAPLVHLLARARERLVRHQVGLFRRAGSTRVEVLPGREDAATGAPGPGSFGERLARLVDEASIQHLVVMGSGAVARLALGDARALVAAAGGAGRRATTNNRYSSDVCALSQAGELRRLPPLPSDNALPRWLEECAGFAVHELGGRERLALDVDTPLDLAILALAPRAPRLLVQLAADSHVVVPRLAELRDLAGDPRRELLVFGRSGSRSLQWLERTVRCRVRFLAEERGLRASSTLAIGDSRPVPDARPPRATLGRLIDHRGPNALPDIVGELADGGIIDTRVLMADRWGPHEDAWPSPNDRFASDLLRSEEVSDPWLRDLTRSAAEADIPILLGAHTLVGPGVPLLLRQGPAVE